MADNFTFDPASCLTDVEAWSPEIELDALIGRQVHANILQGALAYTDDESDLVCKFTPFGQQTKQNYSSAFLLAGPKGNGKHALNDAFIYHCYETDYDDSSDPLAAEQEFHFIYYKMDVKQIISEGGKIEAAARMDAWLKGMKRLCDSEDCEGMFMYIALGDIKPFLRKKKYAAKLATLIQSMLQMEDRAFIITALCNCELSEVPETLLRAFTPLAVDPPDEMQRQQFFEKLIQSYSLLEWTLSAEELAGQTVDFSFLMLRRTSDLIFSWVMQALKNEELHPEDYIFLHRQSYAPSSFQIPEHVLLSIIENVSTSKRVKVQMPEQAVALNYANIPFQQNPAFIPGQQNAVQQPTHNTAPEPEQKQEEKLDPKNSAESAQRPSELDAFFKNMPAPVNFVMQDAIRNSAKQQIEASQG